MSEPSLFEVLNVLKWDLERIQKRVQKLQEAMGSMDILAYALKRLEPQPEQENKEAEDDTE